MRAIYHQFCSIYLIGNEVDRLKTRLHAWAIDHPSTSFPGAEAWLFIHQWTKTNPLGVHDYLKTEQLNFWLKLNRRKAWFRKNIFFYGCYLFVNYTMVWMLRALWLVVALDLSGYRHKGDVTGTCFLFVQHGARFWKCLWDYFGLKQVKASKNLSRNYLQRRKMEKLRRIGIFIQMIF